MSGVLVPMKGVTIVGALGVASGFFAGFSFAEKIYASKEQKSAVRTGASIAAATAFIMAAIATVSVLRACAAA